jgi:hypothetical protein
MIRFTLEALDLIPLSHLPAAFDLSPTNRVTHEWQPMSGIPGRARFYPSSLLLRNPGKLPGLRNRPIFGPPTPIDLILGYGAGNVPGTALLIAFLAQATTMSSDRTLPSIVIKNSRREPLFTPLILSAIENIDPDLVATTALLIWDYEDVAIETFLLNQADLVIAAASDNTIARIQSHIEEVSSPSHPIRFHAHGHKVSFSAIGAEMLAKGLVDPASGQPLLDIITLLTALDSIFWDQHGCLSSRIHFVEKATSGGYTPFDYAAKLDSQLRLIANFLPRGAWPRQQLHDRFDKYKQLETTGLVKVFSQYDDEFLVAVDQRTVDPPTFSSTVNDCQGRVIIIRPVETLMEVADHYLRMVLPTNLQSLSVAFGKPGEGLTRRILRFAEACGDRGVTAIRTVGRGAFPQLSHSWDGLIPLDLICSRHPGYFTTIEFDHPFDQILETFGWLRQRSSGIYID